MKHYFVINPKSGPRNSSDSLINELKEIFKENPDDFSYTVTTSKEDTIAKAKTVAQNLAEDTIIYACGGDGTCYDVLNAIVDYPHAHFGIIPIGSCNDFLKTFPDCDFKNFKNVINGTLKPVDVCHVTSKDFDSYYLNEINIGFDARVNNDLNNSRYKAINVKKAYNRAVFKNLFKFIRQKVRITSSGKEIYNGKSLLIVAANGQYYGSKYRCAPFAKTDDGKFDFVLVKGVSRIRFISLIGGYEKGEHLKNKKYAKLVKYELLDNLKIESNEKMVICLDGEIYEVPYVNIDLLPHKKMMVFPNE